MVALAPAILPGSGKLVFQLERTIMSARLGGDQMPDGRGAETPSNWWSEGSPVLRVETGFERSRRRRSTWETRETVPPCGGQRIYSGAANAFQRGWKKRPDIKAGAHCPRASGEIKVRRRCDGQHPSLIQAARQRPNRFQSDDYIGIRVDAREAMSRSDLPG